MPLHVHYGHNATPSGPGFDINLGSVIQMGFAQNGIFQAPDSFTGLINEAQVGGSAVSSVILDDVDGTLGNNGDAITGLNRMYFIETSCPSGDQRVWNGYIGAREYMRGEESGITPIGAARRILVELADDNAILHFRVAYAADANRPAERAGQRLAWLLGSDYLATVHDNGFVAYPCNPMDKADYRGQYASDVLADISKITGYNYFTYFDEANANIGLWFEDSNTSTDYTSPIQISNVPADLVAQSSNLIPAHEDAKLRRDPSRVAYGVYLPFTGGTYYGTLGPTGAQFGPRDQVAPSAMVKTLSIASNLATRYLNDNSSEDDRITCTVTIPAAQLTAIKVGQRMQVRFSHMPGYGEFRWVRVLRRTIARTTPSNDFYDMTLELSPQTPQKSILLGVVIQSVFTGQDPTLPPTVTVGTAAGPAWNLLAINSYPQGDPSGAGTQSAISVSLWWTDLPASNIDVMYVHQGPIAYLGAYVFEVEGIATGFSPVTGSGADLITRPGDNSFGSLTAGGTSVLFGAYGVQLLTYAYGCDITGISGTTAIVNLDNRGNAYIAYPGYQYIQPPWVFVGYKTGTGAMQLDTHIDTSYVYSPNGRAWVAAAIPLAGSSFSVVQWAGYTGGASVNSDIAVSLPGPL